MGSAAVIHERQAPPVNLSGRIPELDGIRGIAIGMVLIAHFFLVVSRPGSPLAYALVPLRLDWSGVDLFFVLSGFLIGGILLDAREASNYFRVFYRRRFFRIIPLYAACIVVAMGLSLAGTYQHFHFLKWMSEGQFPWFAYVAFLQN